PGSSSPPCPPSWTRRPGPRPSPPAAGLAGLRRPRHPLPGRRDATSFPAACAEGAADPAAGASGMSAVSPVTKAARQAQIADILTHARVRSQEELAELLARRGVKVAQATLSRDLEEIGAVRLRVAGGALVCALPCDAGGPGSPPGGVAGLPSGTWPDARPGGEGEDAVIGTLPRVADLLVSAEASANLVVLRTPAGGAQLLASAIDHAGWASILGTVAGDDTVLVITRDPAGGDQVAHMLLRLAERRAERARAPPPPRPHPP